MKLLSFFGGRSKQLIAVEARIHIGSSFFYAFLSNPLIQAENIQNNDSIKEILLILW